MTTSWNALAAIGFSFVWLIGACLLNGFRNCGDDESSVKFARGYRAGTKLLSQAALLDIVQAGLMTLFFYAQFSYLEDAWQTEAIAPNAMVIYGCTTRILHALTIVLYGSGFFMMEAYHSEGTAECWGWSVLFLYKLAAIAEFVAVVFNSRFADLLFTCLYLGALLSALIWAQSFEPLIVSHEVKMDQSALRSEWFKSRNAMAYYGPPMEEGMELVADARSH